MKMIRWTLITLLTVFSLSAWALDLDDAKASGLVGETPTGYLAAVSDSPSAEVTALVNEVNSKRKKQYGEIASKRNIPLNAVEKLAAKKAYEKTESGHYVKNASGAWEKK